MSWLRDKFDGFFGAVAHDERKKVLLLGISFCLVIGAYTIVRELKDIVFTSIVGIDRGYISYAKILSMLILIPTLFIHSNLVDRLVRHHLVYVYTIFYGVVGLICVYLLGSPIIGLANTDSSPYRIFGWLFYFFIEGYNPLVISVFWAFTNSITGPKSATNNYTAIIVGSKIGGIIAAGSAWLFLRSCHFSDVFNHQLLLLIGSLVLLIVPLLIYRLITTVPSSSLHGYEPAYRVEKKRTVAHEHSSFFSSITEGITLLFKYPYVMGLFGVSFCFDLVSTALKIENLIFVRTTACTMSGSTAFLCWQAMLAHMVGLVIVLFGTRAIISFLGERRALMLVPLLTGIAVVVFLVTPSYVTAVIAFVVIRAVNYALAVPLRESLYIPTIKEIQFKTKPWIDGIGSKFAKTCSSTFNMYVNGFRGTFLLLAQTSFFGVITAVWFVTAYLLGRRFEKALKNNEVIGLEKKPL